MARTRYLKTHFEAGVDNPLAYHLTLNTDWFDVPRAAELIAQAVVAKFPASP